MTLGGIVLREIVMSHQLWEARQSAQWPLYLLTLYTYPGWLQNDFMQISGEKCIENS